jgi:nickel-dependent lactate racemase
MTVFHAEGSPTSVISDEQLQRALISAVQKLGEKHKVLLVPPDFTRFNSRAGQIAQILYEHYGAAITDIMPALGTHTPVTDEQRVKMFGAVPKELFRVHDWRNAVVNIGEVPQEMVREASNGALDKPWPAQVNKLLWEGGHDLTFSIGQVVPHEVMGYANHVKNILIGLGGKDAIDYSHFIGAAYGMERMMGRADTPLRRILNHADKQFLSHLPIVYILTVVGRREEPEGPPGLVLRGLFIGDDVSCFDQAAALSARVNFHMVPKPLKKVVAYMDEHEFATTWLGNKGIYRTRMAIADQGELIILAPGVKKFGEDPGIDKVIRKYGYRTTPEIMEFLKDSLELRSSLSAAAHLIHGSTEGRFTVTYCCTQDGLIMSSYLAYW